MICVASYKYFSKLSIWIFLLGLPFLLHPAETSSANAISTKTKEMRPPDVVFVPTPRDVIHKMFEMADLKEGELVYDLGCGDGRAVVIAAKDFDARAVGYDIDPERVDEAKENVRKSKVSNTAKIHQADIFELDISDADVVFLYLLPSLNVKLLPQLATLKPGARIVSHSFGIEGHEPLKTIHVKSDETNTTHTAYLWIAPLESKTQ